MVQNDSNFYQILTSVSTVEMHIALSAQINTGLRVGNQGFCIPIQPHEINQA